MKKALVRALSVMVVAMMAVGLAAVPANAVVTGYKQIYAWINGNPRCITVPASSTVVGKKLDTWDCMSPKQNNQLWGLHTGDYVLSPDGTMTYILKNRHSGLCIKGWNTKGAQVTQEVCSVTDDRQMWVRPSTSPGGLVYNRWKNWKTGYCLAVSGAGTANGTWLITWDCGTGNPAPDDRRWEIGT
ncbi:RICIN domain-containing protein [Micromonospora sp. NBC_01699]|uniref:RICIN domain-containing protein n=1 Tax=Micromonospora sp. NBC_01699 TaxID=2975984 RepID=UPI002E2E3901|nr:RICIN domain-containing protein [Micromonospora sp. NBC_01699]